MKVLVAEDDPICRRHLETLLRKWGYSVEAVADGPAAWRVLSGESPPPLAVLDWLMPSMEGVEICRRLRQSRTQRPTYVLMLTIKRREEDIVRGLRAGADDYVIKPFHAGELRARIQVGERVAKLQHSLADRVDKLERTVSQVKRLEGLLPICSYCKKVRGDEDHWLGVETYITRRTDVRFSHSICPDCHSAIVRPQLGEL